MSIDRYNLEDEQDWLGWIAKIPALQFDPTWNVKVIPPFGGAVARFLVEKDGVSASVYLDCFDALGYFGSPYWEVYPVNDDVGRCAMGEASELLDLIRTSLGEHELAVVDAAGAK
jgi:hypothetical protein